MCPAYAIYAITRDSSIIMKSAKQESVLGGGKHVPRPFLSHDAFQAQTLKSREEG